MKDCVHEISKANNGSSGGGASFNPDDILTHSYNPIGQAIVYFDPIAGAYFEADDLIVTDNEGNVVTK
jgi:hypothetical protein